MHLPIIENDDRDIFYNINAHFDVVGTDRRVLLLIMKRSLIIIMKR